MGLLFTLFFFLIPNVLILQSAPNIRYQLLLIPFSTLVLCGLFLINHRGHRVGRQEVLLFLFLFSYSVAVLLAPNQTRALYPLGLWLQASAVYLLFFLLYSSRFKWQTAQSGLIVFGAFAAVFYLIDSFAAEQVFSKTVIQPFGMNRNFLANLLIPALFVSFVVSYNSNEKPQKILWALLGVAFLGVIFLTRSRAIWLGVLISAGFAACEAFKKSKDSREVRKRGLVAVVALAAIFVAAEGLSRSFDIPGPLKTVATFQNIQRGSAGGRLRRWYNSKELVSDHLLFGVGPGNWAAAYSNYKDRVMPDPPGYTGAFNGYLETLGESGILSLLLFLAFIFSVVFQRTTEKNIALRCSVITLAVGAFFHLTFNLPHLLYFFFALLGLLRASGYSDTAKESNFLRYTAVILGVISIPILYPGLRANAVSYLVGSKLVPSVTTPKLYFKSKAGKRLSASLVELLPELNFNQNIDQAKSAGRYSSSRFHDLFASFAAKSRGKQSLFWAKLALEANSGNSGSYNRLCSIYLKAEDLIAAESSCSSALEANSFNLSAARNLLKVYEANENKAGQKKQLEIVLKLVERKLNMPADSKNARNERRKLQGIRREVLGKLRRFDPLKNRVQSEPQNLPEFSEIQEAIAGFPLFHKKLSSDGKVLYFSSTLSGRYELWKLNLSSGEPQRVSEDDYVYFQPELSPDSKWLYFLSDRAGDQRFQLYALDLTTKKVEQLTADTGRLVDFCVNNETGMLAVILSNRGENELITISPDRRFSKTILAGKIKLDQPSWLGADSLLVIKNKRELLKVRLNDGGVETIFNSKKKLRWPAVSPNSKLLLIVELNQSGAAGDLLHLKNGSSEVLLKNVIGPEWISESEVLYRERERGSYRLKVYDLETTESKHLVSGEGVVYSPVLDGAGGVYFWQGLPAGLPAIQSLYLSDGSLKTVYQTHGVDAGSILNHRELELGNLLIFQYNPAGEEPRKAVIWLHGSSSDFSPRWHQYAQFFSHSGFHFSAINYEQDLSDREIKVDPAVSVEAIKSLSKRITSDYGIKPEDITLLAVSSGVDIAQKALQQAPELFGGLVEYAPPSAKVLPGIKKEILRFIGENDPRHKKQTRFSSTIQRVVLPGEGHDLRKAESIRRRLGITLGFLDGSYRPLKKSPKRHRTPWDRVPQGQRIQPRGPFYRGR